MDAPKRFLYLHASMIWRFSARTDCRFTSSTTVGLLPALALMIALSWTHVDLRIGKQHTESRDGSISSYVARCRRPALSCFSLAQKDLQFFRE